MIEGIVLAGGAGRRMNGQDKGLVVWRGKAMIDHIIENFAPQVDELILNANRNHIDYQQRGYAVIPDKDSQRLGPLAGIEVGLAAISSPWLAVVPCDGPIFPSDLVQRLYQFAQTNQLPVTWVCQQGRDHPLFCLINKRLLDALSDFLHHQGKRKVLAFFTHYGAAMDFNEPLPHFANFNHELSLV